MGARISSNSWGDIVTVANQRQYISRCIEIDQFAAEHKDFLILFGENLPEFSVLYGFGQRLW